MANPLTKTAYLVKYRYPTAKGTIRNTVYFCFAETPDDAKAKFSQTQLGQTPMLQITKIEKYSP